MKKTIATLVILASASFASAAQQCIASCVVYDKTEQEYVTRQSIVATAQNAELALDDLKMQCFTIGHDRAPRGHATSRDVQDMTCKTIRLKK